MSPDIVQFQGLLVSLDADGTAKKAAISLAAGPEENQLHKLYYRCGAVSIHILLNVCRYRKFCHIVFYLANVSTKCPYLED